MQPALIRTRPSLCFVESQTYSNPNDPKPRWSINLMTRVGDLNPNEPKPEMIRKSCDPNPTRPEQPETQPDPKSDDIRIHQRPSTWYSDLTWNDPRPENIPAAVNPISDRTQKDARPKKNDSSRQPDTRPDPTWYDPRVEKNVSTGQRETQPDPTHISIWPNWPGSKPDPIRLDNLPPLIVQHIPYEVYPDGLN